MTDVQWSFADAGLSIRTDITRTLREIWPRLGQPGTWWTGAERLAIAAETRAAERCALCAERKAALSPFTTEGVHDRVGDLPEPLVDIVHRIRTDAARLTRSWFAHATANEFTDGHYVEAAIVVALVVGADTFSRAIGAAPRPLPAPTSGAPSRIRPTGLADHGAYVAMIAKGEAGPADADLFNMEFASTVPRAISLVPDQARAFFAFRGSFYLPEEVIKRPDDNGGRALTRPQIELLVTRVSDFNGCYF